MREGAAFGRPLPHFYDHGDSFVCLSMELRATALYRHSQRDGTAPYAHTQRYFMLCPALMRTPTLGVWPPIPSSALLGMEGHTPG